MTKKIVLVICGVLFVLVVAAAAIPVVFNVDRYRPQIMEMADQHLNGKLVLGKLNLFLWGQIRVQIDGLKILDHQGQPVVSVQDTALHIPFSSILSGSPLVTFKMVQPKIEVIKDKKGLLNLMSLVKSPTAQATPEEVLKSAAAQKKAQNDKELGTTTLPAMVTQARIGIEILNAQVAYLDEMTHLSTELNQLNLKIRDLSLTRQT